MELHHLQYSLLPGLILSAALYLPQEKEKNKEVEEKINILLDKKKTGKSCLITLKLIKMNCLRVIFF